MTQNWTDKERRALVVGDAPFETEAWLDTLAAQKVTVARFTEMPDAEELAESEVIVLAAHQLSPADTEARLVSLRSAFRGPIMVLFDLDRTPVYKRRAALGDAGATDSMPFSWSEIDLVTRIRALFNRLSPARVLVVEDDAHTAAWAVNCLEADGFACRIAEDIPAAREAFASGPVDAMVIDRQLPDGTGAYGDGLNFLREIRANAIRTPALMFTQLTDTKHDIEGRESANDYISKPCEPDLFVTRVKAALRPVTRDEVLQFGALEILRNDQIARWQGKRIELRTREYRLLEFLAERAEMEISRTMLIQDLWNRAEAPPKDADPVTQAKSRLMAALRKAGVPENVIVAVGNCYVFDPRPLIALWKRPKT